MKRTWLKVLVLVLALCMILPAVVACKPDTPEIPDNPNTPDNPDTPDNPNTPDNPDTPDNPNTPGDPDTPDEPAKVGYVDDGKTYSYRMAPSNIPDNWNYHTYTSNESTYVLSYTGSSLLPPPPAFP